MTGGFVVAENKTHFLSMGKERRDVIWILVLGFAGLALTAVAVAL